MQFTLLEYQEALPMRAGAYLIRDGWNDHGYVTTYDLHIRLADMSRRRIGYLRIAHVSMRRDGVVNTAEILTGRFTSLPHGFFSLGHEDDYYVALLELPPGMGREILIALQDVAFGWGADLRSLMSLEVFQKSVLRGRSEEQLANANRIARGLRARVVPFRWTYTLGGEGLLPAHEFTFDAEPGSRPPTNLHALIGRNGVGKSTLLHRIAADAMADRITVESEADEDNSFNGCVVVSFSPFDRPYGPMPPSALSFHYIGLYHQEEQRLKTRDERRKEFVDSFATVRIGSRGMRWRKAIETLNYVASGFLGDHLTMLTTMMREGSRYKFEARVGEVFDSLSSGHAVVLLMMTRLFEVVGERTLVLIDEPETHLHPPLLAALTSALSALLSDRNGMAIVATHSPVVLQEVPASCVWKMIRHGDELTAHRPGLETYGESVGELTYDVFGLEISSTGFHAAIAEEVEKGGSYEEITQRFSGLGAEARALLRAMTFARGREDR